MMRDNFIRSSFVFLAKSPSMIKITIIFSQIIAITPRLDVCWDIICLIITHLVLEKMFCVLKLFLPSDVPTFVKVATLIEVLLSWNHHFLSPCPGPIRGNGRTKPRCLNLWQVETQPGPGTGFSHILDVTELTFPPLSDSWASQWYIECIEKGCNFNEHKPKNY